jgi:Uncharacterised nucleotidyltransferase
MTATSAYQAGRPTRSASEWPLIGRLLAWSARAAAVDPGLLLPAERRAADELRNFEWALQGGLGPLMHHALARAELVPERWREALLSADLTARVRQGSAVDATLQIIEACADLRVRLTLLKGISVSEQLYPAEHLRPMADIDLLIPAHDYARVEPALLSRGYSRLDFAPIGGFHHGAPLRDTHRQVTVELHTSLFDEDSPFCDGTAFSPSNVALRTVASTYHARPVHRLSLELQLAYIASSWFNDLTVHKVHPSFLASLFDAVYLLSTRAHEMDWSSMLGWLDSDMAKASLYAMATYLPRFGVPPIPAETLSRLAAGFQSGPRRAHPAQAYPHDARPLADWRKTLGSRPSAAGARSLQPLPSVREEDPACAGALTAHIVATVGACGDHPGRCGCSADIGLNASSDRGHRVLLNAQRANVDARLATGAARTPRPCCRSSHTPSRQRPRATNRSAHRTTSC